MDDFDGVDRQLAEGGVDAACTSLIDGLRRAGRYHELFDVCLVQCRHRLGLPLAEASGLDDLPEPVRTEMEKGTLDACRKVGGLLLDEGQLREAWVYLRPAGERLRMKEALQALEPNDENIDAMIDLAIHEGVAIDHGFQWLLSHHGTCNAISTYEMTKHTMSNAERVRVAGLLVAWLHQELLENVRAERGIAANATLPEAMRSLLAGDEARFGATTVHIDVSHLTSILGFARMVKDAETLRLAAELAEYGSRLHETFEPRANGPFGDSFVNQALFFAAQLGDRVDEAVAVFRREAQQADVRAETTEAVEVYLLLLVRLGRFLEAIEAHVAWLPADVQTTGIGPSLVELSEGAGEFDTLARVTRERGDLLGYMLSRIEASRRSE